MAGEEEIPKIKRQYSEETLYRAGIDIEVASLRLLLISLVGLVAADKGDVDKANGFVRRVGFAAKDALQSYPSNNDVYNQEEFKKEVDGRMTAFLDALQFSNPVKR